MRKRDHSHPLARDDGAVNNDGTRRTPTVIGVEGVKNDKQVHGGACKMEDSAAGNDGGM